MTTKMAFMKVITMTFVSVGMVTIALVGIPWASGDPPIDTGGGGS